MRNPALHRFLLRGLTALLVGLVCATTLRADPIRVGAPVPRLEELREAVKAHGTDPQGEMPLLLVFIKRDDAHSPRLIEQLKEMEQRNADLFSALRVVVVLSRINGSEHFDASVLPRNWILVRDTTDALYGDFRIIATPTALVAGADGKVVGFHPGYSPGLTQMIQRDLLMEVRGVEAVRTAAPAVDPELQLGRRLRERGLLERALPYFERAAAKEPENPVIHLEIAGIHVELGNHEQARESLARIDRGKVSEEICRQVSDIEARMQGQATETSP